MSPSADIFFSARVSSCHNGPILSSCMRNAPASCPKLIASTFTGGQGKQCTQFPSTSGLGSRSTSGLAGSVSRLPMRTLIDCDMRMGGGGLPRRGMLPNTCWMRAVSASKVLTNGQPSGRSLDASSLSSFILSADTYIISRTGGSTSGGGPGGALHQWALAERICSSVECFKMCSSVHASGYDSSAGTGGPRSSPRMPAATASVMICSALMSM
mmetsp:Transcript_40041/g.119256  ORF Transcript_40041/g.119256 Transcript_40041/m.119256 type:complete len:213 (+) Transcript_40041:1213-1851(+)